MSDLARGNETQDVVALADMKELAGAAAPCITLVMPLSNPREFAAQLKSALRSLQEQLARRHTHRDGRRTARAD